MIALVIQVAFAALAGGQREAAGQQELSLVQPFSINVDDSVLEDLERRLAQTRFPDQPEGVGWEYGTDLGERQDIVEDWRGAWGWRRQGVVSHTR